jgi:hypothetical protein
MDLRRQDHGIGYWWARSQDWMDDLWDRMVARIPAWSPFIVVPILCTLGALMTLTVWALTASTKFLVVGAAFTVMVTLGTSWLAHHQTRSILIDRRRKSGLCLRCGYDLRESRERCPECGEPTDAEK